jgi:hypothetical protein
VAARGLPVTLSLRSFTIVSTCAETPENSLQIPNTACGGVRLLTCPWSADIQTDAGTGTPCDVLSRAHSRIQQEAVHVDDVAADGAQSTAAADGVAPPGPIGAHPRLQSSRRTRSGFAQTASVTLLQHHSRRVTPSTTAHARTRVWLTSRRFSGQHVLQRLPLETGPSNKQQRSRRTRIAVLSMHSTAPMAPSSSSSRARWKAGTKRSSWSTMATCRGGTWLILSVSVICRMCTDCRLGTQVLGSGSPACCMHRLQDMLDAFLAIGLNEIRHKFTPCAVRLTCLLCALAAASIRSPSAALTAMGLSTSTCLPPTKAAVAKHSPQDQHSGLLDSGCTHACAM